MCAIDLDRNFQLCVLPPFMLITTNTTVKTTIERITTNVHMLFIFYLRAGKMALFEFYLLQIKQNIIYKRNFRARNYSRSTNLILIYQSLTWFLFSHRGLLFVSLHQLMEIKQYFSFIQNTANYVYDFYELFLNSIIFKTIPDL